MKILKAIFAGLRFALFSVLMFVHPLMGVFHKLANICLAAALFCIMLVPHYHTPLWAFLGFGIGLTAFEWFYDVIVARLAPKNLTLIIQR